MANTNSNSDTYLPLAQKFLDFVNSSPTPFHAVDTAKRVLQENGFTQISERERWNIKPLGKYFFTRNQSTIVAFAVGGQFQPGNGVVAIGAHTDSPNLRVKPSHELEKEGYHQLNVEVYGGGLWTTWFDRDLSLAGRVMLKKANNQFETVLVRIDRPLMRIPTLAVHLDRESGSKLEFNKQDQLLPILSTTVKNTFEKDDEGKRNILKKLVANELNCQVSDVVDFELCLFDTQKAVIGGVFNEFIFSPRLDNLMMSFVALTSLVGSLKGDTLANEKNIRAIALFDHEEVGSDSTHGAGSPIMNELVKRLTSSDELLEIAVRKSFFVSADMAHAVHPNYASKHDSTHKPAIHKGVVIKNNANQRYATNLETGFYLRQIAQQNNIPIQEFVVRNDVLCGSTIGPIVASNTGIRTVDIGNPQLSMHSIRETCGTNDITHAVNLLVAFFQQFSALDEATKID